MRAAATRADIYSRVTAKIVADLERGVRPWLKPWNADHAAGRITRPFRAIFTAAYYLHRLQTRNDVAVVAA